MLKHVDPYEITVSDLNERKTENLSLMKGDEGLQDSVAENGVIQPPLVRERGDEDAEVKYEVIVGQRRVLAAQGADLEEIPVVVLDVDDAEAIEHSIGENIGLFREEVGAGDRAEALKQLWEARGNEGLPSPRKLAEWVGGVSEQTFSAWLEPLRREWETEDDVSEDGEVSQLTNLANNLGDKKLREIRLAVEGREEDPQDVASLVADSGLSWGEVKEFRRHVEAGEGIEAAIQMAQEPEDDEGTEETAASGADVTIERKEVEEPEPEAEEDPKEVNVEAVETADEPEEEEDSSPGNPWEEATADGGTTVSSAPTETPFEGRNEVHVSFFVRGKDVDVMEALDDEYDTQGAYKELFLALLREKAAESGVAE